MLGNQHVRPEISIKFQTIRLLLILLLLMDFFTVHSQSNLESILPNDPPTGKELEKIQREHDSAGLVTNLYSSSGLLETTIRYDWSGNNWEPSFKSDYFYDNQNRVIEVESWYWNAIWIRNVRHLYTHDPVGNVLTDITQTWNNAWQNDSKFTYSYNTQGNELSRMYESWNGQWEKQFRNLTSYTSQDQVSVFLIQQWDQFQWKNDLRSSYTYNSFGNPETLLVENWSNQWVNLSKTLNTFDGNQNLTQTQIQIWTGSIWENDWLYKKTYNSMDQEIIRISQTWDNGSWKNAWREEYDYDQSNNKIEEIIKEWDQNQWKNDQRRTWTFDSNNKVTNYHWQLWQSNAWEDNARTAYTYNAAGDLELEIRELWRNNSWEFDYKRELSYLAVSKIDELSREKMTKLFPNPANDLVTVEIESRPSLPINGNVTLYDLNGQEVLSRSLTNSSESVSLIELSPGVYIACINVSGKIEYQRLVKK